MPGDFCFCVVQDSKSAAGPMRSMGAEQSNIELLCSGRKHLVQKRSFLLSDLDRVLYHPATFLL
jgi:hypothetical protein